MPDAPVTQRRRTTDVDEDGYIATVITPIPDPTTLTTAALHRETGVLRQSMEQRFEDRDREARSLHRESQSQFEALEESMITRISALDRLTEERFGAAERMRVEQKKDTKDAVDAALSAAKEAVKEQTTASERAIAKSETATNKQLEQQQLTVSTAVDSLRRSIDEVKERAVEENRGMRTAISDVATTANGTVSHTGGSRERTDDFRLWIMALIGVISLLVAIGFGVYAAFKP